MNDYRTRILTNFSCSFLFYFDEKSNEMCLKPKGFSNDGVFHDIVVVSIFVERRRS